MRYPYSKAPAPYDYVDNPPPADGRKVIVSDTDHLIGNAGDYSWVWKSFTRGQNVNNYMELRDLRVETPRLEQARRAMGDTRRFAERMNLAAVTPQPALSSSGYCLAARGAEYLVYQPNAGAEFSLGLQPGTYRYEWFSPADGKATRADSITATGHKQQFKPPQQGDAVLYLRKE